MANPLHFTFLQEARDYVVITFGLLLYSVGFTCFQLPYEITTGGLAGAGAVLFYATGFPVHFTFFLVNIILPSLLAAVKEVMVYVGATHPELAQSEAGIPQLVENGMFMSCIIGAALEGIGIGLVFLNNGSSGGTDIIASIINKYKDVTLGQMMMILDLIIISSSLLLPSGNVERLLYGYTTLIITNLLLDYVVDRGRQSVQFLVFSMKYDEIAGAINQLHRGVTVLNGQGWYTKQERKVLVVLAKKRESPTIFRIIQNIDPGAFVSQSKVIGVFGYGFDRIKVKADKKDKAGKPAMASEQPANLPQNKA